MTEAAAFAVWLGGALILLAEGRRGLAAGVAVLTAGLSVLLWAAGQDLAAITLAAGGAVAAAVRLVVGPSGWGLMQAGSTPRILLTIVIGIVALYIAASLSAGAGAPARFALLVAIALPAARLLEAPGPAPATAAAAAMALAIGAVGASVDLSAPVETAVIAAVIAAGVVALPQVASRGA